MGRTGVDRRDDLQLIIRQLGKPGKQCLLRGFRVRRLRWVHGRRCGAGIFCRGFVPFCFPGRFRLRLLFLCRLFEFGIQVDTVRIAKEIILHDLGAAGHQLGPVLQEGQGSGGIFRVDIPRHGKNILALVDRVVDKQAGPALFRSLHHHDAVRDSGRDAVAFPEEVPAELLSRRILTDQRPAAQKVAGKFQTALLMRRSQHADARPPGTQSAFGRGFPHAGCQQAHHRAAAAGDLIRQPLSHLDAVGAGFPRPDHRNHRQKVERREKAFDIKNRRRACDPAQPLRTLRCVIR